MQVIIDGSLQMLSQGREGPRLWGEFINLANKNPNTDSITWHEGGHPIAWHRVSQEGIPKE